MVEHRVGGVEFLDLPCIALRQNSNLTSYEISDLRHQGIDVGDDNDPSPGNIPYEFP